MRTCRIWQKRMARNVIPKSLANTSMTGPRQSVAFCANNALKPNPPRDPSFAAIDEMAPQFALPMCRALYRPPRNPVLQSGLVETGEVVLDLSVLFAQTAVDEQALRAHIVELLRGRTPVTLAER